MKFNYVFDGPDIRNDKYKLGYILLEVEGDELNIDADMMASKPYIDAMDLINQIKSINYNKVKHFYNSDTDIRVTKQIDPYLNFVNCHIIPNYNGIDESIKFNIVILYKEVKSAIFPIIIKEINDINNIIFNNVTIPTMLRRRTIE